MNEYVTFKRTALLMLMFIAAWCLPVKGQDNNGYQMHEGLAGNSYIEVNSEVQSATCYFNFPADAPQTIFALFKLVDPKQTAYLDLEVDGLSINKTTGELWIEMKNVQERSSFYYTFHHDGVKRDYAYTISLFKEKNASITPLVTFEGCMKMKRLAELTLSKNSIKGNLDTPYQFAITVNANDFTDSTKVKLNIGIHNEHIKLQAIDATLESINNVYYLPIERLQTTRTYAFTLTATEAYHGSLSICLRDGADNKISWYEFQNLSFPFEPSPTDVNWLKKIATDNPGNTELADYIKNEGWKNDFDNNLKDKIGVRWNDSVPARIRSLILNEQKANLQILDVSSFTDLEDLNINNCDVKSLDISKLFNLTYLNIWNTPLTYDQVKLPENTDRLQINGMSTLPPPVLGEPVPHFEGRYQMPAGSEVDLSAYTMLNGKKAVFSWYKSGNFEPIPIQLDSIAPGKFRMPAQTEGENVWYQCQITTAAFPQWGMQTPFIRLTRGAINYSQDDINLLKALAKANPNCSELQEFIKAEGWKEPWAEYWEDQNRKVAVDWDFSTPARISKLRVQEVDTIVSFNISGFTEMTYLYCPDLKLRSLDLSKNTKLERIDAYNNSLASLDVSKCADLVYLNCSSQQDKNYSATFTSLNVAGCTKLQSLYTHNNPELDVDLSDAKELRVLQISSTMKLAHYASNPPASVVELYYNYTDYPFLDLAKHPQITGLGVPRQVTELDLTNTNIRSLDLDGSLVLYSTLKKRPDTKVNGESYMKVPGADSPKEIRIIENGDTIDFSSEAFVNGVATKYTWVDTRSWTVIENAFIPVLDKPGVFVANAPVNKDYVCYIHNSEYSEEFTLNRRIGWVVRSYYMYVQTSAADYDDTEVAALKAIVDASTSITLKEWWDNKTWQNGYHPESWRLSAWWDLNNETNKFHLKSLRLAYFADSLATMDVSKFKELEYLDCSGDTLKSLSVKENSKLNTLYCDWNKGLTSLILPDNKIALRELRCNGVYELQGLNVSAYTNLETLYVWSNRFTNLDISQNINLKYLYCNGTPIKDLDISKCKKLEVFGVPSGMETFDMNSCDSLKILDPSKSKLKFSTVTLKKGQPWAEDSYALTTLSFPDWRKSFADSHLIPASGIIDLSSEMNIGGKQSTVTVNLYDGTGNNSSQILTSVDGKFKIPGQPKNNFSLLVTNPIFKNWTMELYGEIYTCDGDANLDNKVNVQDIAATASYILKDEASMLPWDKFGYYQADVNYDNKWEVADIIGIANIILGKPVTKRNPLRSSFIPTVELTAEDGFLCMNTPVAIAGVQLEFTGLTETEGLLGKAATFTQASCLGDTSRILGYSLKGETIPAGKSILMKLPAGVRLVKAAFSDDNAQSLSVETRGDLATSNEVVAVPETLQVSNYPNPFRSTTTLVYNLAENVDNAIIQVYAANGRLVHTINGLSVQAGENQYTYTTTLAPGTYFYRLATQKQGATTYSKSNTFIIK